MVNESRTGLPFEESVKKAFSKSKEDINSNTEDIKLLKALLTDLKQELIHLKDKNTILQELAQSNSNSISILAKSQNIMNQGHPLSSSGTGSTGNERVPHTAEQELLKVFKRNKPHIVKQKILELTQETEFALYDIFHVIVEQQRLCGKTTFYRYIKDLEIEGIVEISLIDGKRAIRSTSSLEF